MTTDLTKFSLTAGWLDEKRPKDAANDSGGTLAAATAYANNTTMGFASSTTLSCSVPYQTLGYYPSQWYYTPCYTTRPIRLGLSEVEKLRQAAKRDAKLKAILEKFTDQIEVVVDFK